jgi:hypothetical protein
MAKKHPHEPMEKEAHVEQPTQPEGEAGTTGATPPPFEPAGESSAEAGPHTTLAPAAGPSPAEGSGPSPAAPVAAESCPDKPTAVALTAAGGECEGELRVRVFAYPDSEGQGPFKPEYALLQGVEVSISWAGNTNGT